jgi:hypothetical protein
MSVVDEAAKAALETAASSPKVALMTATVSTSVGLGAVLTEVNSVLGTIGIVLGLMVTAAVLCVHVMKFRLMKREWDKPEGIYQKVDE